MQGGSHQILKLTNAVGSCRGKSRRLPSRGVSLSKLRGGGSQDTVTKDRGAGGREGTRAAPAPPPENSASEAPWVPHTPLCCVPQKLAKSQSLGYMGGMQALKSGEPKFESWSLYSLPKGLNHLWPRFLSSVHWNGNDSTTFKAKEVMPVKCPVHRDS